MKDQIIDPIQVELIQEEIRRNPADATRRDLQLIKLYKFQVSLIEQWYRNSQQDS